jgi:hypothetical protein
LGVTGKEDDVIDAFGGEFGGDVLWGGLVTGRVVKEVWVEYVANTWASAEDDECACHFAGDRLY